jgi:hypothetical protein
MERTGSEPDVVGYDHGSTVIFYNYSPESPEGSVMVMADPMDFEMVGKTEYLELQNLDKFDTKNSSWVKTPRDISDLDGALLGDQRYNTMLFYHIVANSQYAVSGFRG